MTKEEVLAIFDQAHAILHGHFILTSGRHSAIYMQKAHVFMHADLTEKLCRALARALKQEVKGRINYLVGPAIGGLIPCYETSRHLGLPAIWVERQNGKFELRRFVVEPGARVVIIEDIVTTGLSIRETIEAVRKAGADVAAAACIIDRSSGQADIGVPLISLCQFEIPSYEPDEIPSDLAAIPAVKPGSRNI